MEALKNELTAERSLEIITKSIEESRRAITKGLWKKMMLWGVSMFFLAITVGCLWEFTTLGARANMLWILVSVVGIIEAIMGARKPKTPATAMSKDLAYVWGSFAIMASSIGLVCGLMGVFWNTGFSSDKIVVVPITAIIIIFTGLAGMISGAIMGNAVIKWCCFLSGFLGFLLAMQTVFLPAQMYVLAGVFVLGLIIPACILRIKERKEYGYDK